MSKIILVPTSFTAVDDNAIEHAIAVANTIQAEVIVIHVVPKKSFVEEAKTKLAILMERLEGHTSGVVVKPMVRVGTIFEDIGDVAEEISAELIVMGTHGMRGMQFITGSRALKVITSSSTPFIVVQESKSKESGYDDIVVPLDLSKETKQKLNAVARMAKYFDSRVHLISPHETDEFLSNQLTRNLNYAKGFFTDLGIDFTSTTTEKGSGDFDDALIAHAEKINADMITIMNLSNNSLVGMLGNSYVQNILTNKAQIPVLVVNPVSTTISKNVLFT